MPKFTHGKGGVVVEVDDATAKTLGTGWYPVEAEKPEPKTRTRKTS